jgi:hypothetical protein
MATKDHPAIFASPFKFGFYAGVGFFVASALMSVLTIVLVAILGLGTMGALLRNAENTHNAPPKDLKPAARSSDNQ